MLIHDDKPAWRCHKMTSAGPCGGLVALQSLALLHGRLGWSALLLWSIALWAFVSEGGKNKYLSLLLPVRGHGGLVRGEVWRCFHDL